MRLYDRATVCDVGIIYLHVLNNFSLTRHEGIGGKRGEFLAAGKRLFTAYPENAPGTARELPLVNFSQRVTNLGTADP